MDIESDFRFSNNLIAAPPHSRTSSIIAILSPIITYALRATPLGIGQIPSNKSSVCTFAPIQYIFSANFVASMIISPYFSSLFYK
ncbi:MAG: hypothetical protein ACFFE5_13260 [Candidatus Thorarchaeota archaeon]